MRVTYQNAKSFAQGSLRYFQHAKTREHVVAEYLPAGEDIGGPHIVLRFPESQINDARAAWRKLRADLHRRGYTEQVGANKKEYRRRTAECSTCGRKCLGECKKAA